MNKIFFEKSQTSLFVSGPCGDLEAIIHKPTQENKQFIAVVCHPHPLYQGTMNNKVVTTLAKLWSDLGYYTVRFNFRGVGKSAGTYDEGLGEVDDALTIIQWLQQQFPNRQLILSGFSFGSFVAAQAALKVDVATLILIAPPVTNLRFSQLAEFSCPWIVVQGEQDEIVAVDEVIAWCQARQHPPQLILMPKTTHFFHGRLTELREKLIAAFK